MKENDDYILLEKFLKKEATPEEIREMSDFFFKSDSARRLLGFYERKWEDASDMLDVSIQNNMLENIKHKMKPKRRRLFKSYGQLLKYAAIIVLAVLLGTGGFFLSQNLSSNNNDLIVHVENGQKANMLLPDGTKVWLNSGSTICYDKSYNKHDRIISLEGEAYFEVAKDPKRPFIVKANEIRVRALGTIFDIKSYSNDNIISTILIEGKVNVSNNKNTTQLSPNQKITFNKTSHKFDGVQICDAEIAGLWKNNQLAFDSETLDNIAKVLERMYNIQVVFDSEKIKHTRFSGRIKNNSLESILQLIALTSPVYYEVKDSTITLKENLNSKQIHIIK